MTIAELKNYLEGLGLPDNTEVVLRTNRHNHRATIYAPIRARTMGGKKERAEVIPDDDGNPVVVVY